MFNKVFVGMKSLFFGFVGMKSLFDKVNLIQ